MEHNKTIKELLEKGNIKQALSLQEKQNKYAYKDRLNAISASMDQVFSQRKTNEKIQIYNDLKQEQSLLFKVEGYLEDTKNVTDSWRADKIKSYNKIFNGNIPESILNQVENIYTSAVVNNIRVMSDKNKQDALQMVSNNQHGIRDLTSKEEYGQSITEMTRSVDEIRQQVNAGIFTKKTGTNLINEIYTRNSDDIILGSIQSISNQFELHGWEKGKEYFEGLSKSIEGENGIYKFAGDKVKLTFKKMKEFIREGENDYDFRKAVLNNSFSNWVNYKVGSISEVRNQIYNFEKKLVGKISSPNLSPSEKRKFQTYRQDKINPMKDLLKSFERALSGKVQDQEYLKLVQGVLDPKDVIDLVSSHKRGNISAGYKRSIIDFYSGMVRNYQWGDDPIGATVSFYNDLTNKEKPKNVIDSIKDTLSTARQLGLGSNVSIEQQEWIAKSYYDPYISEDEKNELTNILSENDLQGTKDLLAKNYDPKFSKQIFDFLARNSDIFNNIDVSNPTDWSITKKEMQSIPEIQSVVTSLSSIIYTNYDSDLEELSQMFRVDKGEIAQALSIDFTRGALTQTGKQGQIGILGLSQMTKDTLEDNEAMNEYIDQKIKALKDKTYKFADGSYINKNNPLATIKSDFTRYLKDVVSLNENSIFNNFGSENMLPNPFSLGRISSTDTFYNPFTSTDKIKDLPRNINIHNIMEINQVLKRATGNEGNKDFNIAGKLVIYESPDLKKINLGVRINGGVEDLYWGNSRANIQLDLKDIISISDLSVDPENFSKVFENILMRKVK